MGRIVVGAAVAWTVVLGACGPHPDGTIPGPIPGPIPDPAAATDPINRLQLPRLRRTAERVLAELITALPDDRRARVQTVALVSDSALGDVNAYATCDATGAPIVAISDGLLTIAAHLAMSTATDDRFETATASAFLDWLAAHGTAAPPPGFYVPAYHVDRDKLVRQHEVFDEQVAFVLGHELAHHYLGHLACSAGGGLVEEVGRIAADEVPLFSQTGELAADVAAIDNVLSAGAARAGHAWTEAGALLVIAAFSRHHAVTATEVVFAFERTHPLPIVRVPVITSAAELWQIKRGLITP